MKKVNFTPRKRITIQKGICTCFHCSRQRQTRTQTSPLKHRHILRLPRPEAIIHRNVPLRPSIYTLTISLSQHRVLPRFFPRRVTSLWLRSAYRISNSSTRTVFSTTMILFLLFHTKTSKFLTISIHTKTRSTLYPDDDSIQIFINSIRYCHYFDTSVLNNTPKYVMLEYFYQVLQMLIGEVTTQPFITVSSIVKISNILEGLVTENKIFEMLRWFTETAILSTDYANDAHAHSSLLTGYKHILNHPPSDTTK